MFTRFHSALMFVGLAFLIARPCFPAGAQPIFPASDTGETRSRAYHVVHYKIDVAFNEEARSVEGTVTTTLVPFLEALDSVVFDAEDMQIRRVALAGGPALPFSVRPKTLVIFLPHPCSFRDTLTVSVAYSCTPKKGLYFTQPDSLSPWKPSQIWTQGEDMDSHFWFPCYDFPNDFSTSEVIATVPARYTVLSNGKLVGVRNNRKAGTRTFHWSETKPHASYLITLAAGTYAILKDKAGNVPLEYYVYPDDTADARACFSRTPDMLKFFSRVIGYPYPWEKYAQVLIADFTEGGMENASATSLRDDITVRDARARLDNTSTSLIAHELAHQWWGDVVTCKDWRHIWLNESFASYFDPLYHEYWLGEDEFDYIMYGEQQKGIMVDARRGRKPIVSVDPYIDDVYSRGAAVLHMLRFVLGDTLFRRAMHHYIVEHQFTPVETNDLKNAIEESTGQNLYWFFDEWVYKAGYPVFDLSYRWNDTVKSVLLTVRQTQHQDSLTGVFRMPVDVEIRTRSSDSTHRMNILSADTTFAIPSDESPRLVMFDPGNWLLKEVHWDKGADEWALQAVVASNPVERIRALKELSREPDNARFLPRLADAARHDKFWAVREEAVALLGSMKSDSGAVADSILAVLLSAAHDTKSAVRIAAVRELSMYERANVAGALRSALNDPSYGVVAGALYALSRVDSTLALPLVRAYVDTPSYHDIVSNTALVALSRLDSSAAIAAAFKKARHAHSGFGRYTALEILKKYRKGQPEVTDLFIALLHDRNRFIRSYAARTLGEIGDRRAVPALTRIAEDKENSASEAAQVSLEMLKESSSR